MKKRLLSTLLVLCMVLSLLPIPTLAEQTDSDGIEPVSSIEDTMFDEPAENQPDEEASLESVPVPYAETASGICGDNLTWTLTDGVLTIQGTGAMDDYVVNAPDLGEPPPWYDYREQIRTIIIGEGVTEIGGSAFCECSNLTSVTIPEGVTSIESYAFQDCTSLVSITIPEGVWYIGSYMFFGCTSLANVTIPKGVILIGGAAFEYCTSLTSVTIPEGVTSIRAYMFIGCSALTSVTIPESVTSIENRVFEDCTSLTSIAIPKNVTSIGDEVFEGCTSLTDVYYSGSKEDWDNISIGNGNEQLLNATIHCDDYTGPNTDPTPSVVASGTCGTRLTWVLDTNGTLTIQGTGSMYDYDPFIPQPWSDFNEQIHTVNIVNGVANIGNSAFYRCSNLVSVTIPDSVTVIGPYAFSGCSNLTSVVIPSRVTSIGFRAFVSCSSLTNVNIPDSVTSIGQYAFLGCSGLTSVTISNNVTTIEQETFRECSSLTSVNIPNSVTSIGDGAFSTCKSLINVTIPDSVTSIGESAFVDCNSLTSVTISDTITIIREQTFYNCSSLTSVTIPDSVINIERYAFAGCRSLIDVYYSGSEADWNAINIDSSDSPLFGGNRYLTNATIHYNSTGPEDTDPTPGETETGKLGWNEEETQWTIAVDGRLELAIQMEDGHTFDASKLVCNATPYGIIVVEEPIRQEGNTAYVTVQGVSPGQATLTVTLSPNITIGENILDRPTVSQIITVVDKGIRFEGTDKFVVGCGKTFNISALVAGLSPQDAEKVKWTTEDDRGLEVHKIEEPINTAAMASGMTRVHAVLRGIVVGEYTVTLTTPDGQTASFPVFVSAAKNIEYPDASPRGSGQIGDEITWVLHHSGILEISGSGPIPHYNSEAETPWAQYRNTINTIKIGTQITGIGKNAFKGFTALEEVKLPNTLMYVAENAFNGDNMLAKAEFGGTYPTDWNWLMDHTSSGNNPLTKLKRAQINAYSNLESVVNDDAYGVNKYTATDAQKALQAFTDLKTNIEKYIKLASKVTTAEQDKALNELDVAENQRRIKVIREGVLASALKTYESQYLLANRRIDSATRTAILDAICLGFADKIDEEVKKNFDLGKIDLNAGKINGTNLDMTLEVITVQIINRVGHYLTDILKDSPVFETEVTASGGGIYKINVIYSTKFSCYMIQITTDDDLVEIGDGIPQPISFSQNNEETMMRQYLEALCGTAKDVLQEGLKAYFKYLNDLTEFGSLLKEMSEEDVQNAVEAYFYIFELKDKANIIVNAYKVARISSEINTIIKKGDKVTFSDLKNAADNMKQIASLSLEDIKGNVTQSAKDTIKSINTSIEKYWNSAIFDPEADHTETVEEIQKALVEDLKNQYPEGTERITWVLDKIGLRCPVDFRVYNSEDKCIGYVEKGEVWYEAPIAILTEGDCKDVYIPGGMDVRFEFTGTDQGEMTYVMEEVRNGETVGRKNYYGIPLSEGATYTQSFHTGDDLHNLAADQLIASDGSTINGSEYLDAWDETISSAIYIDCVAEGGGSIAGAGNFAKGDAVTLYAAPDDGQEFIGWYLNDKLISVANPYQFAALNCAEIHAKFRTPYEESEQFDATAGIGYWRNTVSAPVRFCSFSPNR